MTHSPRFHEKFRATGFIDELAHKHNIAYAISTDGVQPFKHMPHTAWFALATV